MRRTIIATILAALLIGQTLGIAVAAPATLTCPAGQFDQQDLAGTYTNIDGAIWPKIALTIAPCDDVLLGWGDLSGGLARTTYTGFGRLPGGGIGARARTADPKLGYLHGADVIGIVPAEPGVVTLYTVDRDDNPAHQYRLTKRP